MQQGLLPPRPPFSMRRPRRHAPRGGESQQNPPQTEEKLILKLLRGHSSNRGDELARRHLSEDAVWQVTCAHVSPQSAGISPVTGGLHAGADMTRDTPHAEGPHAGLGRMTRRPDVEAFLTRNRSSRGAARTRASTPRALE